MGVPSKQTVTGWANLPVVDPAGTQVGTITALYVDEATDQPEWLCVQRPDGHALFVPVLDAEQVREGVRVPFSAEQMTSAPTFGEPRELTQQEETDLYEHYGVAYSADETVLPTSDTVSGDPVSADPAPASGLSGPDRPAAPSDDPAAAARKNAEQPQDAQPERPAEQPVYARPVVVPAAGPPPEQQQGVPPAVLAAGGLAAGVVALVVRRRRRRNAADRLVGRLRRLG